MELQAQLKAHRNRLGLSQEELAERIFVSRQTISNWETDRTYPDVQSLLLLSSVFETSLDELVKGDVEVMEETIEKNWKKMSRLGVAAWALIGVGIVCLLVGFTLPTGPSTIAPKFTEGELLGVILFFVMWLIGMVLISMVEFMKRKYDLVTYSEIIAFSKGQEPTRNVDGFQRKHPLATNLIKFVIAGVVGFLVAFGTFQISNILG